MNDEYSPIICEKIATDAFPFEPNVVQLDENLFQMKLYTGFTGQQRDFGISYMCSYLENTLECVRNHDDFDVLAHLTYISKCRCHPDPRPVIYEDHKELLDEILRVLAQKGKGLEMNTSGVDRCGDFLPYEPYFRRFKELGGQIVTVGSDAHTSNRVGQYTFDACEILKDIFGHVCTFEDRKPIFHKV